MGRSCSKAEFSFHQPVIAYGSLYLNLIDGPDAVQENQQREPSHVRAYLQNQLKVDTSALARLCAGRDIKSITETGSNNKDPYIISRVMLCDRSAHQI
jgi:hypothetical protein